MKVRFPIEPRGLLLAVGLGIGGLACVSPAAVAANAEGPFLALNETVMNKMMAAMAVKPTRDADRNFVAMMVRHHQGATDLPDLLGAAAIVFSALTYSLGSVVARPLTKTTSSTFLS